MSIEQKEDLSPSMDTFNQVQKGGQMANPNTKSKKCRQCGRVTYNKVDICVGCQNKK